MAQALPNLCAPLGCFAPGTEGELWQSLPPFGIPDDGTCSNADPTLNPELPRTCPDTGGGPPPLGQFLYPYAVAVDGPTIYVSDQFNHRVQAFKADGTPQAFAHLIGNGIPGDASGQLNEPEGVAVDAEHNILVADSANARIAVFQADGTPAPTAVLPVIDTVSPTFSRTVPTGIALSPGTTLLGYHVPVPAGDRHRIVVTDRNTCFVYIYDAGFNLRAQIPAALPSAPTQGACVVSDDPSHPPAAGMFGSTTGAAIDANGHIYVADYDNSRIQILDLDGNVIGTFGTPPDPSALPPGAVAPPSSLQFPWAVLVDHAGRVVVTDTDNQRIAFFTVDFSSTPPTANYLFQLNAGGTLNGFPTGIAEQTNPDAAGRILVTDTTNHRVQWFQLPDLAIVLPNIDGTTFTGTFGVAVPAQKAASAIDVRTLVTATNADIVIGPTAQPPANASAPIDIAPGQIVTYSFTYVPRGRGPVSFQLSATANNGLTAASAVDAAARVVCATGCHASAAIYRAPLAAPPVVATATSNWYRTPLVVRISADSTTAGVVLTTIAYQFTSGAEAAIHGGTAHLIDVSGSAASVDVPITQEGTSVMSFWAVYDDGSQVAAKQLSLSLDLTPPAITFNAPAPTGVDASGAAWNNAPILVSYTVNDDLSGTSMPDGSLAFSVEGRNQKKSVVAADLAGNIIAQPSDLQQFGGRPINIDTNPPTFSGVPAAITIELTGPGVAVMTTAQATLFKATATDPLLSDGTPGSGIVSISNPVAGVTAFPMSGAGPTTSLHAFVATDAAGNSANRFVNVTVSDTTPPVFSVCPATLLLNLPGVAASVALPNLSGLVAVSDLSGTATVSQSIAPGTLLGPGVRTVNVTATDPSGNTNVCAIRVTVNATTLTIQLPAPMTVEATAANGAAVSYTATMSDPIDGVTPASCTPASGSTFSLGMKTVYCTATNTRGTTVSGSFTITVVDTTPPVLTVPADFTIGATSASGANVTYTATSLDLVDGSRPVACTPASGVLFRVGTTTVSCTATDTRGNAAAAKTFVVTVLNQPPTITQVNLTAIATSAAGAAVSFAPVVNDAADPHPTVSCTKPSGTTFPVGTTAVTCTAINRFGLQASAGFTVTVNHSAPVCTAAVASPGSLWPPNHDLVPIAIDGLTTADRGTVTTTITSIFQDEPTNGLGDGDTAIDGYGVGTTQARVRSERSGNGNGRVYYIAYNATTPGGSCMGTVTVGVPHDQGHPAVGDGARYDSTKAGASHDDCHGEDGHGHHDGDGCDVGHHGHYDGDNCRGASGYHHDGDNDRDHKSKGQGGKNQG